MVERRWELLTKGIRRFVKKNNNQSKTKHVRDSYYVDIFKRGLKVNFKKFKNYSALLVT